MLGMLFNNSIWSVALRYIRSRKKKWFVSLTTLLSFVGIMLGVATLIIVMSVMNGFHTQLLKRIIGLNAHVAIIHDGDVIENYQDLIPKIEQVENVVRVNPLVQGQALGMADKKYGGVAIRGMRKEDLLKKKLIADNILEGSLENFGTEKNGVLIGVKLANSLGVWPGRNVKLISPQTTATIMGNIPRIKDYKVIGVFEAGMHEYDLTTMIMPMKDAQTYLKLGNNVTSIEVMAVHIEQSDVLQQDLTNIMPFKYSVINWDSANDSFFNALEVERNVMFLILTLIILVAAFNIVSGMVMLVTNKRKEIAILRTMGMNRSQILKIFFITGCFIGVVGTLLGILLGVGFSANIESIRQWLEGITDTELFAAEIYFLSQLPAEVKWDNIISITAMSLGLSMFFSILPAWSASRLDPVEGLHHD